MRLADVRAIVSGGASGLGLAAVARIVAAGGQAVLLDINQAQAAAALEGLGPRASFIATDVTREGEVEAAVEQARARMGSINAAINCAGIGTAARFVGKQGAMTADFFRRLIEVNLVGTALVCKSAALAMQHNPPGIDGERGVIVMTASVAAFDGQIGQVAYAASKGGIVAMTLPMARELASSGIRVVTIAPGVFLTPMAQSLPPEAQQSLARQVPFPARLGRPDEYASLVAQILENVMLNGETIRLDGAIRMQPR
ncbi:MAG TPA: SDR family NAD(P)-dependent oxidoreductase [Steroidobacteraceae bacterium]|jgi:NAD(P)-dependent dehydrogenase (short-subunit alcohol dehydrogenase family)|nr:SDR family NAD(P)-dependent oxidoreductase [Steroidobacteraceae bacterium]